MKEFAHTMYEHLFDNSHTFDYWQVYLYWIVVIGIFMVDNIMRHRYNYKLKVQHRNQKVITNQRLEAARFEIRGLKREVNDFTLRDGGCGSVMDIKDYRVQVRSVTFNKSSKQLINWTYTTLNTNFPKIKG